MANELLIVVPGLSVRAPEKHNGQLLTNIANVAAGRGRVIGGPAGASARVATGAAGGDVVFQHPAGRERPEATTFVLREVVWGDIPTRLTELGAIAKFKQGFFLLAWVAYSLVRRPGVLRANKYQSAAMIGSLLLLVLWYIGVIIAVPTVVDSALLPDGVGDRLREAFGTFASAVSGASVWGVKLWVVTSLLMGLLPVTAVVDAAFAMRQYVGDGRTADRSAIVGEEARLRIAKALTKAATEQDAEGGKPYGRITVLTHSFGAVPTLEALAAFGADLKAPVRLITLGAPLVFAGALRRRFLDAARSFREAGEGVEGLRLESWTCFWSRRDYLSSRPADLHRGADAWPGFVDRELDSTSNLSLGGEHGRYFDEDDVAAAILDGAAPATVRVDAGPRRPEGDRPPPAVVQRPHPA